jgi:hypothetical protein
MIRLIDGDAEGREEGSRFRRGFDRRLWAAVMPVFINQRVSRKEDSRITERDRMGCPMRRYVYELAVFDGRSGDVADLERQLNEYGTAGRRIVSKEFYPTCPDEWENRSGTYEVLLETETTGSLTRDVWRWIRAKFLARIR